jgi:quaternary ammonium compound-resistance protein SugE
MFRRAGTTLRFPLIIGTARSSHKELTMNWIVLVIAGLFETGWAVGLKYTEGFTRLGPSILTVISMIVSLGLLGLAMRDLPLGTAYAVWTGIGTIGTVIFGIVVFGESADLARLVSIGLIGAGIVGLKLVTH